MFLFWFLLCGVVRGVGVYNGETNTYKPIGKSWTKYVKKCFFGNFFLDNSLSNNFFTVYTASLDIPKNRFDRFGPTFVF